MSYRRVQDEVRARHLTYRSYERRIVFQHPGTNSESIRQPQGRNTSTRLHFALIVIALIRTASGCAVPSMKQNDGAVNDNNEIDRAYHARTSNVQVNGEGLVERVLDDDLAGSKHQRFIVRLASGPTVLILHNIDIAQRVTDLQTGDSISFYGEYVWNAQGGMVHWTHHDPEGRHVAGWLKHKGRTYQ